MKKIIYFLILLLYIWPSYSQKQYDPDIESVLIKSGSNRHELERFLDQYEKDKNPRKRDAACFLVRNMDIHYSETFYWVDSANNIIEFDELSYSDFSHASQALKELSSEYKIKPVVVKEYDMHHVKADYLTDNLERAFEAWEKPHSGHLTFDEFCEYILPYRNVTEKLEDWREAYTEVFSPSNPESKSRSVKDASNLLNNRLTGYFASSYSFEDKNSPVSFLAPSLLLFRKRGYCEDMVNLTWLAFKSQGIPCRIDMVPYHGTSTGRHYWNAVMDEQHKLLPFEGSKNSIEDFSLKREPAKVISLTYSKQAGVLASLIPEDEIPPNFLRQYNYKDVTDLYWTTLDLTCELTVKPKNGIAYVAVLNGLNWRPVYWGSMNPDDKTVTFPKMGSGVAYLPMIYENNKLEPAGFPVLVAENKETRTLIPDVKNTHTIVLKEQDRYLKYRKGKKYKLFYWNNKWTLLATKTAADESELSFDNVPKNALLLLVPEYSQKKERPFYITTQGERLWW